MAGGDATLKIWFEDKVVLNPSDRKKFFEMSNEAGSSAYKSVAKMNLADVVVVASATVLPKGILSTQKVTTKKWFDDVLLEGEPIDITRRYQAGFQSSAPPPRPAANSPAASSSSKSRYVDSDTDSSEELSAEETRQVSSKKGANDVKKGSTTVGIMKVSESDSEHGTGKASAKKTKSKSKEENPNAMDVTPKVKKSAGAPSTNAKRGETAVKEQDTPSKAKKSTKATSTPRAKRGRANDDTDSDASESEKKPVAKRSKKTATAAAVGAGVLLSPLKSAKNGRSKKAEKVEGDLIIAGAKKTKAVTAALPKDNLSAETRIYISQCPDEAKRRYRSELAKFPTIAVVRDVSHATHVVYYDPPKSAKSKVSLSVLYAVAWGKWIVKKEWIEAIIQQSSLVSPDKFELMVFPGCQASRKAHQEREDYLTRTGVEADDDFDMALPRLVFSDLTFSIDRLRSTFGAEEIQRVESLILACAGRIGNDLTSDIWIIAKPERALLAVDYGEELGENSEDEDRLAHPEYRKRHFRHPETQKKMPTWALDFDYIRDSITQWKTMNMDSYPNHLTQTSALAHYVRPTAASRADS